MSDNRNPYTPYYRMETGFAQLAAMDMAIKLDDDTRNRQAALIRALWRVVGVQSAIIFFLLVFA
jgi:hypothetical protein